jgi:predicted acetyltransferase
VNEYVAHTPDAHRGLTGYLHGLRDQAVEIVIATPPDAPWAVQLADAANLRGEMKMGVVRSAGHAGYGAMLRLVDVKAALEMLPVASQARGEVVIEVRDKVLPQNERAWHVQARDGRLRVRAESVRLGRDKLPRLVADAETLAILTAGAIHPVVAAETGLVEDVRGAAEVMESWFRTRPVFLMPMNAF